MKNNLSLVILSGGVGSRFGGLKQLFPITKYNEQIMDFTIFDAINSGFTKLYLIIQEEYKDLFDEKLVNFIRNKIDVEYIFQDIPENLKKNGRTKPLGSAYALYCCKDKVKEPFVLCNADDYYGKEAFEIMYKNFQNNFDDNAYMVGYLLKNTLSKYGGVSRAKCTVEDSKLLDIDELLDVKFEDNKFIHSKKNDFLLSDDIVSMNFWGFNPNIFEHLSPLVDEFINDKIHKNILKDEFFISDAIKNLVNTKKINVNVSLSNEKWFGITYKDDIIDAQNNISLHKNDYPKNLWGKKFTNE